MKRIPILMFAFGELDHKVQATLIEELRGKSLKQDWARPVIDRFYDKMEEFTDNPNDIEVSFDPFGKNIHFGLKLNDMVNALDGPKLFDDYLADKLGGHAKFFSWKFFVNNETDYKFVGYFFVNDEKLPLWRTSPNYALKPQLIEVSTPPTLGRKAMGDIETEMQIAYEAFWRDIMNMCKETFKELMEEYEFQTSDQVMIDRLNSMEGVVYTKDGFGVVLQGDEHTAYAEENKDEAQFVVLNMNDESNPKILIDEKGNTHIFSNKEEAELAAADLVTAKILPLNYLLQVNPIA